MASWDIMEGRGDGGDGCGCLGNQAGFAAFGEGSGGGRGSKQLNAPCGLVQGNKTVSWLVAPTSFFFISILVTLNTS